MHSFSYSPDDTPDVYFNFNGDFSGDLIINFDDKELTIPCESVLELVAYCYIQSRKVARLENMSAKEVLDEV